MKIKENFQENRRLYMAEFSLWEDDHYIIFNIVDVNYDKNEITVAVSNEGKISVCTYDLISDSKRLFFEYGVMYTRIMLDDFVTEEDLS